MCRPLWHDIARGSDAAAPNEKWKFPAQQRARLNRRLPWLTNALAARYFRPPFLQRDSESRKRQHLCMEHSHFPSCSIMNASTAAVAAFVVAGLVFGSFYVGSQMISRPPASIATP
jgi:hypothetical protein